MLTFVLLALGAAQKAEIISFGLAYSNELIFIISLRNNTNFLAIAHHEKCLHKVIAAVLLRQDQRPPLLDEC